MSGLLSLRMSIKTMETKICKKCSCEQELCCFPKDSTKKDGLHPHCKKCRILYRQTMKSHIKNKVVPRVKLI